MATGSFDMYWVSTSTRELAGRTQALFLGGTVVAAIGFTLPWFNNEHVGWSYSGLQLMTDEIAWLGAIYAAFLLLLVLGATLFRRSVLLSGIVVVAALFVSLSTLVPVMLGVVEVRRVARGIFAIEWGIGLPVMLIGEAALLFAAIAGFVLQVMREALVTEPAPQAEAS